jgi:hypothetical protein
MGIGPERQVPFERLHNFRDLGGYPADGGRPVRAGLLYRSDSLGKLSGTDADRLSATTSPVTWASPSGRSTSCAPAISPLPN